MQETKYGNVPRNELLKDGMKYFQKDFYVWNFFNIKIEIHPTEYNVLIHPAKSNVLCSFGADKRSFSIWKCFNIEIEIHPVDYNGLSVLEQTRQIHQALH